jgi:hypothetical protein
MRTIIFVLLLSATGALAQDERSQMTFSGGNAVDVGRFGASTALSFGGSYSYRLLRHLGLETGVLTALDPTGVIRGENFNIDIKDRFTWVQFGPRFILPLWDGRLELSAGAGGVYEDYSPGSPSPSGNMSSRTGWGGNFSGGAAIALDPGRHFWLGMTPRYIVVTAAQAHDRWFIAAGELSFRF